MQPKVLSPHVFSWLLSKKIPLSEEEQHKAGKGEKLTDLIEFDFADFVSQKYWEPDDPKEHRSEEGYILIDSAAEFLQKNFQGIYDHDLHDLRVQRTKIYLDMLIDAIGGDDGLDYLKQRGFDLEEASKHLPSLTTAVGESSLLLAQIDGERVRKTTNCLCDLNEILIQESSGSNWPFELDDAQKKVIGDFSKVVHYFASKLSNPELTHQLQKDINMPRVFLAIRAAYDLLHRNMEGYGRLDLMDTSSTYFWNRRVVQPEVVQQRIMTMGTEIALMFPDQTT